MKITTNRILTPLLLTLTIGCAYSKTERKLDAKLARESSIKTWADLRTEVMKLIERTPGLSPDQKSKLRLLHDANRKATEQVSLESIKLRTALVEDLMSPTGEEDEVALIKKRLKGLEEKRLAILFETVEQANVIMGHEAAKNRKMIHDFLHESHFTQAD